MLEKGSISEYRGKLDKTLRSPDLRNDEALHTLVRNQILQSSNSKLEEWTENVIERRCKEVSNFMSMLRSASGDDVERSISSEDSRGSWKVKQDTEELRVMYREGPEGTPFHTLLAEGFVDGPADVCLCISCESDLYPRWWPQTAIPTFKVISSKCLQRIRTGEQISLVRMKVSWPLSSREAVIHYFTFEYFQDGLIVVLLNSIADAETISKSTHGFTRDGIPDALDVVRMDVVGGFALQKVSANRSYFRTIANMDIKLDIIPPAFINFMSRQLVGSGFKLYKKEVASVSEGGNKFSEALKDPSYARIRESLYSENIYTGSPDLEEMKRTETIMLEENGIEDLKDNDAKNIDHNNYSIDASETNSVFVREGESVNEIEELEKTDTDRNRSSAETTQKLWNNATNEVTEKLWAQTKEVVRSSEVEVELDSGTSHEITRNTGTEVKKKIVISPEVEEALSTLEKAISIFRGYYTTRGIEQSNVENENSIKVEKDCVEESVPSQAEKTTRENGNRAELLTVRSTETTSHEPRNSIDSHGSRRRPSNSHQRETNQSKIAPASPDEDLSPLSHAQYDTNQRTDTTVIEKTTENHPSIIDANNIGQDRVTKRKNKKYRYCCINLIYDSNY